MNGLDNLVEAYIYNHLYNQTVAEGKKAVDVHPTFASVRKHMALAHLCSGR